MKIHQQSAEEALASLHASPAGLTSAEAGARLAEFGPNRIEHVRGAPTWLRLLRGFTHFFALILWLAAGLAFFADRHDPGGGMGTLGAAIVGVILVNGGFSFWQEHRAERALAALQSFLPREVKVLRDGTVRPTPAEGVVPGDVVLLDDGDEVPADCRVLEAFGLRVNNATVTGESLPQARDALPCERDDLVRGRNVLLAGTSVVAGQCRALVFATGRHTEFGQIARLTQAARPELSPLQREIVRLSRLVAVFSTLLGIVFFLVGRLVGLPFWQNFLFAIGIIVANVPEGLLPTVTLALALGSQRMARRRALVRHLPAVETLGAATVICTDKTGTLTLNRMEVRRLFLGGRFVDAAEASAHVAAYRPFFEATLACHTLKEGDGPQGRRLLGDPMEIALVEMARSCLPGTALPAPDDEVPFDTDRKRMSTLHGDVLYTKGAPETVLSCCTSVRDDNGDAPLTAETRAAYTHAQGEMARAGLRVLAVAVRRVPPHCDHHQLEAELTLFGLVGLEDPPRPEVPEAVRRCRGAGIRVIMVTGDHPQTAVAIARRIGLVEKEHPAVITGDALRRLSATQLRLALRGPEVLFARVGADQKLRVVEALKAQGHVVAATGDGVNDAPALRAADIGVAMGRSGTDVAREAADIVLLDDNFASIVAAVEEGRAVFANLRKFLTYILTSNVPELVPYLAFVLFRVPLALTILQILAVDLGTDMLPALALGAEKPEPGVMGRPPRPRTERLLTWGLLLRAYGFLGLLEAGIALAAFFQVLIGGGWRFGEMPAVTDPLYREATTACLAGVVVAQVFNVFLCRSSRQSARAFGLGGNRLLLVGIAVEVALLLLLTYTEVGNRLLGTAPLGAGTWGLIAGLGVVMFLVEEGRKWWRRRRTASRPLGW